MKTYELKKGSHSASGLHIGITFKKKIEFRCKFDDSCLYGELGNGDEYDINKLFGFSTTWWHHKQSGRVGWRCIDGETIQILTYSYNKGKRDIKEHDILGVVKPGELFYCTIEDTEKEYVYTFKKGFDEEVVTKTDAKQKDWFFFHYLLFPYFGGNKPAPHNMKIHLEKL
jgi:hypothetical protein